MFENDADRLAIIKSLGGQLVSDDGGQHLWAIFEHGFSAVLGSPEVETSEPYLQCRTSDFNGLMLSKDSQLLVGTESYRIRRAEPDGTGMTRVVLKR